jgi:hypothetical protein
MPADPFPGEVPGQLSRLDPVSAPGVPSDAVPATAEEGLSAEEQLARFEEELKNSDWGHQPC